MGAIFKYLALFFIIGLVWFGIFSIQVSKKTTLFAAIQKELKITPEDDDNSNKKQIDRQNVIDAISRAFDN